MGRVSYLEQRASSNLQKKTTSGIGRDRLIAQPLSYCPKPSGKRFLRLSFITFLKKLMATERAVRERWRQGDTSVRYPSGLFPPSRTSTGCRHPIRTIHAFSATLGGRVSF